MYQTKNFFQSQSNFDSRESVVADDEEANSEARPTSVLGASTAATMRPTKQATEEKKLIKESVGKSNFGFLLLALRLFCLPVVYLFFVAEKKKGE